MACKLNPVTIISGFACTLLNICPLQVSMGKPATRDSMRHEGRRRRPSKSRKAPTEVGAALPRDIQ